MATLKRLRVAIQGRVQGVGFRYFTADRARELDLTGWVRNVGYGEVEVVAEGEQGSLEALLAALKAGPSMARIEDVHAVWLPYIGEFRDFHISPGD